MEKTLKELLSLWMIGEDMKKYMFFSLNIFWWNRIAKIMQFISAFTVIADILGAARLNQIGRTMTSAYSLEWSRKKTVSLWKMLIHLPEILLSVNDKSIKYKEEIQMNKKECILSAAVGTGLYFDRKIQLGYYSAGTDQGFFISLRDNFAELLVCILIAFVLVFTFSLLFSAVYLAVGYFINLLILTPTGDVLTEQKPENFIRKAGLFTLIAGFIIDLFTS